MTTITKMTKTDDGDGDGDDDDDSLFLSIHVNGDKIDINRKAVIIPKPKKKNGREKEMVKNIHFIIACCEGINSRFYIQKSDNDYLCP